MINSVNDTISTGNIVYGQDTGTEKTGESNGQSDAFLNVLNDALNELTASTAAFPAGGGIGMPGTFLPMPALNNTLEQAILQASSSGNSDDAMMALLMLMMMMESSSGGGDISMLMPMMTSMMERFQGNEKKAVEDKFLYASGASPDTLDTIDSQVFGNPVPAAATAAAVTAEEKPDLPLQWWRPTTPVITSSVNNRDPELYNAVVAQFDVENAERYRPGREGYTYCNVFVWDVTRAMGAELPYYVDAKTGEPREYPDTKGTTTNGAVAMDRWLKTHGEKYGWFQVSPEDAQMLANEGKPVVSAAGDIGHVQMVVPSKDGLYDPVRGVAFAQAGRTVTNYRYTKGFYGADTLKNKITYWAHD